MKAEEVYNIAIHLSEMELERLYALLKKRICKKQNIVFKSPKKLLITDEEARRYLLKTVFKMDI
ncbi:hypothetical protein [Flavobacterium sp. N1994]|uniref:hypothetical protein n=1 Tax=Flavobacterium sp. N1994 TaxID=2986827 RepID=UPI0022233F01|nr:hypothetical protein [Flavobacterium sp. N1994]